MIKHRAVYVVFLVYASYATAEGEPPSNTNNDQSWMSRLADWLYPFGGDPPPTSSPQVSTPINCNPCNENPWVPMATNYGDNTVVNFVPPASSQHHFSAATLNQFMVPPPPHYARYAPIDMRPPPPPPHLKFRTLPTLATHPNQPPSPLPSDSYGTPLNGLNAQYGTTHLVNINRPIPVPNLSSAPVLPLYPPQDFNSIDDYRSTYTRDESNVQVIPSIKLTDFISSIDHPVNVEQSPLLDLNIQNEHDLDEKPIYTHDTHPSATAVNETFSDEVTGDTNESTSRPISGLNYNFNNIPVNTGSTLNWDYRTGSYVSNQDTTKKPKQIQIIVPYIKRPFSHDHNYGRKLPLRPSYNSLLPIYVPPSTSEQIWTKFAEDFKLAQSKNTQAAPFTPSTTQVSNIMDLLKGVHRRPITNGKLPFDVISLQNTIDDWTQSAYQTNNMKAKFVPSKKIPDEYFTTVSYPETTEPIEQNDYEAAGSNDIETNFVLDESSTATTPPITTESALKADVFVVTPEPTKRWSLPPRVQRNNNTKFLIRVEPQSVSKGDDLKRGALTVVLSEWPHLINNLQTTTPSAIKPTSWHPLFGLMGLSSYSPPINSTVRTIDGHSKVATTVATPSIKNRSKLFP